MNNDNPKTYKKNGKLQRNKSSKEMAKDWGIHIGDNLTLERRILNQPKLIFNKHKEVNPRNRLFRKDVKYDGVTINKNEIMYIYSKNDKTDFRLIINNLFSKANMKGIIINMHPKELYSYGIKKTYKWEGIIFLIRN